MKVYPDYSYGGYLSTARRTRRMPCTGLSSSAVSLEARVVQHVYAGLTSRQASSSLSEASSFRTPTVAFPTTWEVPSGHERRSCSRRPRPCAQSSPSTYARETRSSSSTGRQRPCGYGPLTAGHMTNPTTPSSSQPVPHPCGRLSLASTPRASAPSGRWMMLSG